MYVGQRAHDERAALRFATELENSYYELATPLTVEYRLCDPPVLFEDRPRDGYEKLEEGAAWGEAWQVGWFHVTGRVPKGWAGQTVVARLEIDGEICIYDEEGCPVDGLTSTSIYFPNWLHDRHLLFEEASGGETIDFWFEATAAKMTGVDRKTDPPRDDDQRHGTYTAKARRLSLCVFDRQRWHLFLDANLLSLQMQAMPETSVRRKRLTKALCDARNCTAPGLTRETIAEARRILAPLLASPAAESDLRTVATGHAHLDTGWLWPIEEGIRKCSRTFSRQLAMLDRYPDYVFGASQAQHYAFVKERYPKLFERIKAAVAAGRWEVQGIMWVEADTNLIGAESMVRQVLYGHRFFRDELGVEPRNLWLPDVFGYSAALPAVLHDAGVTSMMTQKLSWNTYDRPPHHTFRWRGLTGGEVLVHFPPEDTYNSVLNPAQLMFARDNFEESAHLPAFLTLFGLGDGGGGPNDEIIEKGLRQRDLEGVPRVEFAHAQTLFDHFHDHANDLAAWQGELYLERHQGTLTTQAASKRYNRRLEHSLRAAEMVCASLPLADYPIETFTRLWRSLLLHQFHDILPGSSIHRVYEEAHEVYGQIEAELDALIAERSGRLVRADDKAITLINTLSCEYRGPVVLPGVASDESLTDQTGGVLPTEACDDGVIVNATIPALGCITLRRDGEGEQGPAEPIDDRVLENDLVRYEFDERGRLVRIFDKALGEEMMRPGMLGNRLVLHSDRSVFDTDAWDVEIAYESQPADEAQLDGPIRGSAGPVRQTLHMQWNLPDAPVRQAIHLSPHSKRLDFVTDVDWRPRHRMLRAEFEVDVHSDHASYEIQFGVIQRPTHRNTTWDFARYEVCGHRFADLSEPDRGVALLNDCKYGHKIHGNTISLNLLRSPTHPDPDADIGEHHFTYSLLPHVGPLAGSDVPNEARRLNQPPIVAAGACERDEVFPIAPPDADNIVVEAIKRSEDEPDAIVVRLYESLGVRTKTHLTLRGSPSTVDASNVLEQPGSPLPIEAGAVSLSFHPFEIKTLVIRP